MGQVHHFCAVMSPFSRFALEEGGIGYLERSAFCGVRERKTRFGKYLAEYQGGSSLPASITSKRLWQLTRDSTESAELYRELFAEIADGNPNNRVEFWFPGQPEVASGRQIQTKIGRSTFFGQDPDWKALASYFEGKVDLSPERLLGTAVVLEVDGEPIDHTSLLSCLHMELEYEGEFYVHDRGFWLRASGEHVQSVRRRIEEFEVDHRTSGLLDWDKEWDEDRFNTENGKLHCWQCSHPRLWTEAGQRYGIELADLIGANGQTVHVKKYKSVAKSLSHLLSQTQAAAGAYAASQSARAWINDYRTMIPGGYVGEHATIVIALGSSQFAKMSQIPSSGGVMAIGNAISSITQLGYGLQLVTVPIEDV